MSQSSSPARPAEPAGEPAIKATAPAPRPVQDSSGQLWKIAALALALAFLSVLVFLVFTGPVPQQTAAPDEEEYVVEEEVADEPAAAAPAPPPAAQDPRPFSTRSSSRDSGARPSAPALPPMQILSVGYSHLPALRVVALRLGGALPYFLHEGDSIGDIKILAILSDRVQISHAGQKYEVKVGSDGQVQLPARGR